MSYKTRKLAGYDAILTELYADFDLEHEIGQVDMDTIAILEASDRKLAIIIDFQTKLNFEDILLGANTVARGEAPVWHHPKVKKVYLVSNDPAIQAVAKGMSSPTFGSLNIQVVHSVDEAKIHVPTI